MVSEPAVVHPGRGGPRWQTAAMAHLLPEPTIVPAAGDPPKIIAEVVGRVATGDDAVSIAVMRSPAGWAEPGQRPEFDEYTIVLEGEVVAEGESGPVTAAPGQAIRAPAGEWVRYATPGPDGARYVSVCLPAFSPERVHRDV